MAAHSNILAWEIPWTKEPGWLQSTCCRVKHNWALAWVQTYWIIGTIKRGEWATQSGDELEGKHRTVWVLKCPADLSPGYHFLHLVHNVKCLSVQFSSVAQSCPTLCDAMNRSTPGLPVHHQLQVHPNPCPLSWWCHPAISSSVIPFSSCPQSLPASESFPMSQLFTWGGQSTGVSASASFLPKKS